VTTVGGGRQGAAAPERASAAGHGRRPGPALDRTQRPVGRRLHHLPTLAVMAVLCVGLIAVSLDHWRKGSLVLGTAPLLAAVLRLVLPSREVAFLTVRGKGFDVVLLAGLGAVLIALAEVVPVYYHVI